MKSRWVVGGGVCLEQVFGAWSRAYPQESVQRIEPLPGDDYAFDLHALDALDPAQGTMFVAFDERFGNFKRMELMQLVMERGFKLESFVSPSAIVPPDAIVGPNAFVGEGVVLGIGCRIDFNAVVRDGARLGAGVHLRSSCWLETGVLVGDGADIGAHSILRIGAVVAPLVKIGKHSELGWAQRYDQDVAARTIFDARYPEPICVYGD
jgi:acyl-[acyl carrier protein]--UDP-N-acetylglucosamine O-acyltransferase